MRKKNAYQTAIAGSKLPTVQAAVKPPEGKPYWFKLADAAVLPEGLELEAQTGHVSGEILNMSALPCISYAISLWCH